MASRRVVLVGWDSADWRVITPLLDAGHLPHLERIVNGGVVGDLHTVSPTISPSVWTTVATGVRPIHHGVFGYFEPLSSDRARAVTSATSRAPTLWRLATDAGRSSAVIGWPATDPPTLDAPRSALRVHPEEIDADALRAFVPQLAGAMASRDPQIVELAVCLAELSTVHAAATWRLEHEHPDFLAVRYGAFERLARRFMAYHPPRMDRVTEADFDRYSGVIATAYRYMDLMLGRLVELSGSDATIVIVSAHGFHSGDRRPQPAPGGLVDPLRWHRRQGIFCAKGPGIPADERVYGLTILDVAPRVLAALGIDRSHEMAMTPDAVVDAPVIEGTAARAAWRDWFRNLAIAEMEAGRFGEAAAALAPLVDDDADDWDTLLLLANVDLVLGRVESCRPRAKALVAAHGDHPAVQILAAGLAIADRLDVPAAGHLHRAEVLAVDDPHLLCEIGAGYARLAKHDDAERAFRLALAADPDSPGAYDGLAVIYLQEGRAEDAADAALEAIARDYQCANAHFHLGVALSRAGWRLRAIRAFETYQTLKPESMDVRRELARLHTTPDGQP